MTYQKKLLTTSRLSHIHHCPLTREPVWAMESFKDVSGETVNNNTVLPPDMVAINRESFFALAKRLADVDFLIDVDLELVKTGKSYRYWTNGYEFLISSHRHFIKFVWVGDIDTLPKVELKVIAALDSVNGVIGIENQLPWKLKNDMRHFSATTRDSLVISGRKTLESMGGALPNRRHLVLTKNHEIESSPGLTYTHSTLQTIRHAKIISTVIYESKPVWIIGGSMVYELLANYVDELILTKVESGGIKGDAKFPLATYERLGFVEEETLATKRKDENNDYDFSIVKVNKKAM